jgi:hypothetical protein
MQQRGILLSHSVQEEISPIRFPPLQKNPQLGDLNLAPEYWLEVFKELNIAVNYPKKLIHVYRATNVIYAEGFEKYKDNMELIDNWWLPHYTVGATQTETHRRVDIQSEQGPSNPEIHHHSDYVHPPEEEESASRARHIRDTTDPRRPDRAYINSLMTGGMTAI